MTNHDILLDELAATIQSAKEAGTDMKALIMATHEVCPRVDHNNPNQSQAQASHQAHETETDIEEVPRHQGTSLVNLQGTALLDMLPRTGMLMRSTPAPAQKTHSRPATDESPFGTSTTHKRTRS